jgi:hypothetical protein
LIGFCPYLRHEYSSAGMSATLGLMAGTRTVRFGRCFLRPQDQSIRFIFSFHPFPARSNNS